MVSLLSQEIMIDEHQLIHSSRTASSLASHFRLLPHKEMAGAGALHPAHHLARPHRTRRQSIAHARVCHDEMRTSRSAVPPSRKAHEELSINPTAESPPVEGPHVAHVARSTWVGTRARAPSARWTSSPRLPRLRKGRVTKGAPRASGTRQSRPSHWSSRARRPQPWPCRRGT